LNLKDGHQPVRETPIKEIREKSGKFPAFPQKAGEGAKGLKFISAFLRKGKLTDEDKMEDLYKKQ